MSASAVLFKIRIMVITLWKKLTYVMTSVDIKKKDILNTLFSAIADNGRLL